VCFDRRAERERAVDEGLVVEQRRDGAALGAHMHPFAQSAR
jgi:hypothetical protein